MGLSIESPFAFPLTLTREELVEITGYKQVRKQKAHFDRLGIPNIIRPNNTLSVARAHYNSPLERLKPKAGEVKIVRRPPAPKPWDKNFSEVG